MALAGGAEFAGYVVERTLGSGATGEVYLVRHPRFPRRDTLKVFSRPAAGGEQFGRRFLQVAATAVTLRHPHLVQLHDYGEFDGRLWAAMDFVAGTDAAHLMRNRFPAGMPVDEVLAIVTAVGAALDFLHQRGVVHGGVKPASILLADADGGEQRILLTGFGIAQLFNDTLFNDTDGRLAGNPDPQAITYGAPELSSHRDIDGRADEYALAATAFHLLTGVPPTRGGAALSERRPELAYLDEVFAIALADTPDRRFSRCREFADALSTRVGSATDSTSGGGGILDYPAYAGTGMPAESMPAEPVIPGNPPVAAPDHDGGHRRRWILGLAAGLVAVVGAATAVGLLLARDDDASDADASPAATGPTGTVPALPPTSHARVAAAPPPPLEGSYRVDVDRSRQTYNGTPAPQPPTVTTWWAFRSSCTSLGCVAAGVLLDGDDHQQASSPGGGAQIILDFRDGAWQARPQSVQFPCVDQHGTPGNETTTQVLSLRPDGPHPLRGAMTVTVETAECGQRGARIEIPATAVRVGAIPPAVSVPDPLTAGR